MPVCAMEALALGVPVITCDARGCREVVRDGVDGVVLRDARASSLHAAMHSCSMTKASANAGPRRRSPGANVSAATRFIAEQTRIYESLFNRPNRDTGCCCMLNLLPRRSFRATCSRGADSNRTALRLAQREEHRRLSLQSGCSICSLLRLHS